MVKVKGVKSVDVDFGSKQALVTFDKKGTASLSELLTALRRANFKPSAV